MASGPPPRRRPEIHLGDLARALAGLEWQTDAQAARIAACLGFGLRGGPQRRRTIEAFDRHRREMAAGEARRPGPAGAPKLPPAPAPPPALPGGRRDAALRESTGTPLPQSARTWAGAPAWPDEAAAQTAVARESLFPDRTGRHIVTAALATPRAGQAIDVPRLVRAVSRREVLRELPRETELSVQGGCQLLLDYSVTMTPFWTDLGDLARQIGDVVGGANVRTYSFDRDPLASRRWTARGGKGALEDWAPDGSTVVAASDLGISPQWDGPPVRVGSSAPWDELARRCRASGSQLLILVPWPEALWPAEIDGHPVLVHWSPDTTAGMVVRGAREARAAG